MTENHAATQTDNSVLKSEDLNAEMFSITDPRKRKGSSRITSYLLQNGNPIYTETPWLKAPFGISGFKPDGSSTKEWSINLSANSNDADVDDEISRYFEQWEGADNLMIQHGIDHSKMILGKEYAEKDRGVVEALYKEVVKGKNTEYPLRLQPKIPKARDSDDPTKVLNDTPNVAVFMEGSTKQLDIKTFEDLEKLVPKGGLVKAILQPKTWYIGGKYGLSLTVLQLLVKKRTGGRPTGYSFSDNADDNNSNSEQDNQLDSDDELNNNAPGDDADNADGEECSGEVSNDGEEVEVEVEEEGGEEVEEE